MSIVSSRVVEDAAQKDGRRYLRYGHTDHNGLEHVTHVRLVPADFNADPDGDAARQELSLDTSERQQAISRIEVGEDSLAVVNSFDHSTQKELAKALIYEMVRRRDPYFVLLLEPLIEWIKANFSAAQIQSFLDITSAQLTILNNKYNAIIAIKADLLLADIEKEF